ncbi:MAG: ABC transporter substrate-binding protein, partial [Alphaproteobacteria bacterium]
AAVGEPKGEERVILECLSSVLPEDVLAPPEAPPTTDGSGWPRANLRKAFKLLDEAGWAIRDLKLVDKETGRPFRFEILLVSPAFERIVLPYKRNLQRLGIDVSVRLVDQSQYINRLRQYDYDVIISGWGQSESPGNEQRDYWGSEAAARPGGRNYIGIAEPGIDALIELLIEAPDRKSLIARTRALDRALLAGKWLVPNWHLAAQRILYWDKFGQPAITPYKGVAIDSWWFDADKAAKLTRGRAS